MKKASINIHQSLIDRCRKDDRQAQFELYQQYSKAMYNISLRMVRDSEDAQDVLQDAFVAAFRNLKQYTGTSTFGAWLKRIVINKCIDHIKKKRLQIVDLEHVDYKLSDEGEHEEVLYKVSPGKIHEAIKQLPEGCRVVFSLYMLEGYDHKEIADVMDISESTSKSQFSRAKKLLKQKLA